MNQPEPEKGHSRPLPGGPGEFSGDDATDKHDGGDGDGEQDMLAMAALEELPAPDAHSPESLIGSTPATRDPVSEVSPGPSSPAESPEAAPSASTRPPARSGEDTTKSSGEVSLTPETPGASGISDAHKTSNTLGAPGAPAWVSLDELDELTIVARAQDGDPQAFEWLINAYQGGVYRLCYRMLNDRSDAEDVVQETFIAAWRSLPKLTVPQAFIPWLYRTATNKCLDDLRRRKRRPADPTADLGGESRGADLEDGFSASSSPMANRVSGATSEGRDTVGAIQPMDPAQEFENQAQMRALADLLQTVPPGPRACWLLREVHEFSYLEIAAIVQLPESTVRGRIARAKRLLAEGMEPWR